MKYVLEVICSYLVFALLGMAMLSFLANDLRFGGICLTLSVFLSLFPNYGEINRKMEKATRKGIKYELQIHRLRKQSNNKR